MGSWYRVGAYPAIIDMKIVCSGDKADVQGRKSCIEMIEKRP
jgi:hypothetical protein